MSDVSRSSNLNNYDHSQNPYPIGANTPDFSGLKGTDGKTYGLSDFSDAKALVMIFTCNHCPYAQAYEDRLIQLAEEFMPLGIGFLAINSNHAEDYPEDSFENMVVRAAIKNLPYPYVLDIDQSVARDYRAICTPHTFVIQNRKLVYRGRIDDSWMRADRVTVSELRNALEAIISEAPIQIADTHPMGCSIRWTTQEENNPERAFARQNLERLDRVEHLDVAKQRRIA